MRTAVFLARRIHRLRFGSIATKNITLRNFAMAATSGENGKTNSWQGLGAAEFDLRSWSTRRNMCVALANAHHLQATQ
jgi:threonine aldolase